MACNRAKRPYVARAGRAETGSSTDSKTWRNFEEALAVVESGRFPCFGRVIETEDPFVGIDLDECRDPETGEVAEWAIDALEDLDSYSELSPSGQGFKIWVKVDPPWIEENLPRGWERVDEEEGGVHVEVYPGGRFFTVTGHLLSQYSSEVEDRQEQLEEFLRGLGWTPPQARRRREPRTFDGDPGSLIDELIEAGVEVFKEIGDQRAEEKYQILCPWVSEHTGKDESGTYVGRYPEGDRFFQCHHAHCRERVWRDFREETGIPLPDDNNDNNDKNGFSGSSSKKGDTYRTEGSSDDNNDINDNIFGENRKTPPFPVEVLPRVLQKLVEEGAKALRCPPDFVAIPVLCAISGAIGYSRIIRIKEGWTDSGALYAAVVGPPGSRKTPAQSLAVRPLNRLQGQLRETYQEEMEIYRKEWEQYEIDKKQARREERIPPPPPPKPTLKRCIVDDITVEALAKRLQENPRGLLAHHDELTGFLKGMDQYKAGGKGNARQVFLKIWSNDTFQVDRKTDDETLHIPDPYVTIQGGIQPSVLDEIGAGRDDGFLDRFIFAYPEPMRSGWSNDVVSPQTEISYRYLIEDLWRLKGEEDGREVPWGVSLSEEARELFIEQSDLLEEERYSPGFPEVLRAPWGKMDTHLARLALLMATIRGVGMDLYRVESEDMMRAIRLLDYFRTMTRKVYEHLFQARPDDILARDLVTWLSSSPNKSFSGTMSSMYKALDEAGYSAGLPGDHKALGRAVRKIIRFTPQLEFEEGTRQANERPFTLRLIEDND